MDKFELDVYKIEIVNQLPTSDFVAYISDYFCLLSNLMLFHINKRGTFLEFGVNFSKYSKPVLPNNTSMRSDKMSC